MASSNKYAIKFDGSNDYISLGTTGLPTGDSSRTVEFWMKPEENDSNSMMVFCYGALSNTGSFDIAINPTNEISSKGKIGVHAHGEYLMTKNVAILKWNEWYHLAVTYDGGGLTDGLKIYINGIKQELMPVYGYGSTTPLKTIASNFNVGRRYDGYYYQGIVDEIRLWNFARLEAQIIADRHRVLIGTETGLVGYWRFEEGVGVLAQDSSVSKNNGSLQNGASFVSGEINLLSGQKVEEIGLPIDISKGTFNNIVYMNGRLQLKPLYEITTSVGNDIAYVGEGTESKPYLIRDAYDIYKMRFQPYAYYKMMNDVDMGISPFDSGFYFGFDFYGTLDGNGFKIKNFKQLAKRSFTGLFTRMYGSSLVKNLFIEDAYVECIGYISEQGIIVGQMYGASSIRNVMVTGTLKTRGKSGTIYAGVIGYMSGGATVYDCYFGVNIDLDEAGLSKEYVGIITGRLDDGCKAERVLVEGNIVGTVNNYNVIGILVGYNYAGGLTDLYYNKDLASLGISATNNVVINNADKSNVQLQDTVLYERWGIDIWRIKLFSKPKLRIFDRPTHALVEYGEWESDVIDLVDKYTDFKNLVRVQNVYEGANVIFMTKTSDDNIVWSPYSAVNPDGSITSPKARYVRVKVRMYSGKNRESTVVESFNGNIHYDKTPFITIVDGKLAVQYQSILGFTEEESYTSGGFLYKTKILAENIRQIDRLRINSW
ncbi:LamG domain-containing protein [Brevibacillus laterosporus]|uniref:LamG domain-containing protein n=1 Tax=Brevibacillus laterosporus TaxID=1465 RepID=UPI00215D38BA|nr:LamG domain-containing protein [Brevibacillus laterosporus]MCR8994667.1 LamG domain-containing protein [Brevibacillus laterosporus]